jgi:hypothetical protein
MGRRATVRDVVFQIQIVRPLQCRQTVMIIGLVSIRSVCIRNLGLVVIRMERMMVAIANVVPTILIVTFCLLRRLLNVTFLELRVRLGLVSLVIRA